MARSISKERKEKLTDDGELGLGCRPSNHGPTSWKQCQGQEGKGS
jgi:hypothetical protein